MELPEGVAVDLVWYNDEQPNLRFRYWTGEKWMVAELSLREVRLDEQNNARS